ncbi:MAG TPA: enoyl-CoA hydratase/isomerase family protein [Leeuwenhoekiella sp.]|nr:enoyl-CoA hydratase/isomerase family protein [Leeuwenhoekiella sp.]
MNSESFKTLQISIDHSVANVTIDNPPVNVLDIKLMTELRQVLTVFAENSTIKVIVFDSANPDFFIAHVDMSLIDEPDAFSELEKESPAGLNVFQAFGELLRNQPQVTIIKLKGIARGGGAEFIAAADMSFAAIGQGKLAQCEALMGIIPGGGATQYLSSKMGRARALEVILGAAVFDAVTAERYGWINRAIPADKIDEFIYTLSHNIASLPEGVISTAKRVIPAKNLYNGYKLENDGWAELFKIPAAEKLIRGGIQKGAQTKAGELKLEEILRGLSGS